MTLQSPPAVVQLREVRPEQLQLVPEGRLERASNRVVEVREKLPVANQPCLVVRRRCPREVRIEVRSEVTTLLNLDRLTRRINQELEEQLRLGRPRCEGRDEEVVDSPYHAPLGLGHAAGRADRSAYGQPAPISTNETIQSHGLPRLVGNLHWKQ